MEIKTLASSSKGNAILVKTNTANLLFDCGLSEKDIRKKSGFCKIDSVFITHEHIDHSKSAKDFLKLGVGVYTSKGTADKCGLAGNRLNIISSLVPFNIGEIKVIPFDTQHDAIEPLGFYMEFPTGEKLLYVIDTFYIKYRFSGITHLLVECNYCNDILARNAENGTVQRVLAERIRRSHLSLETLLDFLDINKANNKLKQIYLLHLSDVNSDEQKMLKAVRGRTGAEVYI